MASFPVFSKGWSDPHKRCTCGFFSKSFSFEFHLENKLNSSPVLHQITWKVKTARNFLHVHGFLFYFFNCKPHRKAKSNMDEREENAIAMSYYRIILLCKTISFGFTAIPSYHMGWGFSTGSGGPEGGKEWRIDWYIWIEEQRYAA